MNNILMFVMFMILFGFGSNSGGKAQYGMISAIGECRLGKNRNKQDRNNNNNQMAPLFHCCDI